MSQKKDQNDRSGFVEMVKAMLICLQDAVVPTFLGILITRFASK